MYGWGASLLRRLALRGGALPLQEREEGLRPALRPEGAVLPGRGLPGGPGVPGRELPLRGWDEGVR
jgi:hypothetical protein